MWLFGFAVFLIGELLNFVSMSFASQTLLAVLGSFSPLSNVFMAPFLLKEPITRGDILALPLIIGGAIVVVFYSDHSSQVRCRLLRDL
jgi:drug/metabolite transporter (DMT)-like permease